jgi:hypothetical protein
MELVMQENIENQVRERAYHLWLAAGCREGESAQHWLIAEREVLAAFAAENPLARGNARRAAAKAAKAPAKSRRRVA